MSKIDKWADYLPPEALETYRKAAFGNAIGYGRRAALLNVDTTLMFVDAKYPLCGAEDPALIAALTGEEVPTAELEDDDGNASGPRNGTFHIYASASGTGATVAAIEAVVRISRASKTPFTIVDWREPPRAEFPPREGVQG